MAYAIGIDVGGTKIAYGLYGEGHTQAQARTLALVHSLVEPARPDLPAADMLDRMASSAERLMREGGVNKAKVRGVGAAFPSFIEFAKGKIIETANLPHFKNVAVRDELAARLGLPVVIDNDANAAALAENRLGAGKGFDQMVYITVSTGIGTGLILNGELYRGAHGWAGELGHMLVNDSSPVLCGCGKRGCVEGSASGTGVARYVKARVAEGAPCSIIGEITSISVERAAEEGDALAREAQAQAAVSLGKLFYNIYQSFDVDCIVYGGGASKNKGLISGAIEWFEQASPRAREYPVTFLPARFGADVGMVGAALLVV